ncbi:MAG: protoporphyrinogen oxidase, partial [Candidatus Hydrogenedentota bacterium]
TETAADRLGSALRLGAAARSIQREGNRYRITVESREEVTADAVIVALPPRAAEHVVSGLDPEFDAALAIPSIHILVVFTAYRRDDVGHDLNGFGFLVPRTEGKRVLGCIWASSVFPKCAPDGSCSLRTMIGGAHDPDAVELTDDELLAIVKREVHPLLKIGAAPSHVRIYRHRNAIPQYTLEHQARIDALTRLEERHPRFVLAGNAYTGVGLNDCVASAKRAVDRICAALG